MTAQWLRQLGHEAYVLEGGVAAAKQIETPPRSRWRKSARARADRGRRAGRKLGDGSVLVVDLRPSMSYRKEHIAGAVWSIRPRVATDAKAASAIVLVADRPEIAALAALDLAEAGMRDVRVLSGGHEAARAAGLQMASTPSASGGCGLHRPPVLHGRAPRGRRSRRAAVPDLGDRPGRSARCSGARLVPDCRAAGRALVLNQDLRQTCHPRARPKDPSHSLLRRRCGWMVGTARP